MCRSIVCLFVVLAVGCESAPLTDVSPSEDQPGFQGLPPGPTEPASGLPAPPPNIPPVADAGPDVEEDATITGGPAVSALGSTDPDGEITSYEWRTDNGGLYSGPNPVLTGLPLGKTVVTLTVTDDAGAQDTDELVVTRRGPKPDRYRQCYELGDTCPLDAGRGSIEFTVRQGPSGFQVDGFTYHFSMRCYDPLAVPTEYLGVMPGASIEGRAAHSSVDGVDVLFDFSGEGPIYDEVRIAMAFPGNGPCHPLDLSITLEAAD